MNEKVVQPYVKPYVEKEIEKAKKAIEVVNAKVVQPYVKPYVEKEIEKAKKAIEVVNAKVVQPYVKPYVEKEIEKAKKLVEVVNEKVIQPYVKPYVEKEIEKAKKAIEVVNEKVIQPYIVPAVTALNEKVVQPYVKPLVDKAADTITKATSWVDEKIYQPLAAQVSSAWDKYGETVHGALDVAGFIPGFGEIADGINGLIYLGEGRYIEASISAAAMIPIVGDLGKAGKWTVKVGKELVEVAAEAATKQALKTAAKEAAEQAVEKIVKESAEVAVDKAAKKALKKAAQEAAQNALEKSAKSAAREAVGEAVEKAAKEAGGKISTDVVQNVTRKSVKEYATSTAAKEAAQAAAESKAKKLVKKLPYYPPGSPLGMTPKQLLKNKAAQKQLYEMATSMNAEQAKYAQKLLKELGINGAISVPLKGGPNATLDQFIESVLEKCERNHYTFVGEMDDMTRGRFELKSWDDVETVTDALKKPGDDFKVFEKMNPRVPQPDGGYAYPRYHEIVQDPETLITHEWQVGNKTTSELFESEIPGIDIPKGLQLNGKNPNLHDISYKIFKPVAEEYPEVLQQHGLSQFFEELDHLAAQTGELGDQVPNLPEGIGQLHSQASDILKTLFEEQGSEVIEQFYH